MPSPSRWTLVATILASSMTFIDATVVNVALPALQADLHATITDVQWVIEAYALFLGALILVGGSMGDQFGRKRVFLFGVMAFTARVDPLRRSRRRRRCSIVGRALQGIGAAFLVPGSLAIISATFDDAERGRAIGTWSGFSAITTAIGPVSGGWLVEHVSWRAAFFLNVPLAVIVLVLSLRFMNESRDPSRTAPDRLERRGARRPRPGRRCLRAARMAAARGQPSARARRAGDRRLLARAAVRRGASRAGTRCCRSMLFRLANVHARQCPDAAALRGAERRACSSCR